MPVPYRAVPWLLAAALLLVVPQSLLAQDDFPGKRPIEFVVLFPAGSSADVTARVLAEGMGRRLGTQVVVVNRPGGGGAIGYRYAVSQAADGHHLVWNSNSISTTYHTGTLPFDYQSFTPVARVQIETPFLFVRRDAPWKTVRDIVEYAKANPGKVTVGNSGFGSHTHLSALWLFRAAGAKITDVPFNAAQVVPSLLGGEVNAVVQLPGALAGHITAGSVRALVALSGTRDPSFPEVPTAKEAGWSAVAELWRGVVVPKGTPRRIVATLEDVIRTTVRDPEFTRAAEKLLVTPAFLPGAEFGKLIAREDVEIAKAVAAMGLKKSAK